MNLLELKNLLSVKIKTVCRLVITEDENGILDALYDCYIDKKYDLNEFINHIRTLKDQLIESLFELDSKQIANRALVEYNILQNQFSIFEIHGVKYCKYNNLDIYDDEFPFINQIGDEKDINPEKLSLEKQAEYKAYLEIENPSERDFLILTTPTKVLEITKPEIAKITDRLSVFIKETLDNISSFIKLHFPQDPINASDKKELDRLNVKQQILILHYLFNYYQNSEVEIPNNRLSQLLGSILGRNSETIRSLLTYMPRVEDNESDDKIAKTPKNLTAVHELFNALKLQPLQVLVEKDIEKMKKINK
jgi:hypothetical protein